MRQEILKIGLNALKTEITEFCSCLYIRQIENIFKQAGFPEVDSDQTRRGTVYNYYNSVNWSDSNTISKFLKVVETILLIHDISEESKQYIKDICDKCGFKVIDGHYIDNQFISDLFIYQFPAGLPYGKNKPNFYSNFIVEFDFKS